MVFQTCVLLGNFSLNIKLIAWNTVCGAIQDLLRCNVSSIDNPVEVFNEHPSILLIGRYVPTKDIRMHNKDKPWFDCKCTIVFDIEQEAGLVTSDRSLVTEKNLSAFK